jgi:hypothetical protein
MDGAVGGGSIGCIPGVSMRMVCERVGSSDSPGSRMMEGDVGDAIERSEM